MAKKSLTSLFLLLCIVVSQAQSVQPLGDHVSGDYGLSYPEMDAFGSGYIVAGMRDPGDHYFVSLIHSGQVVELYLGDFAPNDITLLGQMGSSYYFLLENGYTSTGKYTKLCKVDDFSGAFTYITDLPYGSLKENIQIGSKLYFSIETSSEWEVYVSDGTAGGTGMLKNIYPSGKSSPFKLTSYNGELYFAVKASAVTTSGNQLWKSNGTEAGTVLVKNFQPEIAKFFNESSELVIYNSFLYFVIQGGGQVQLWRSDGSTAGTLVAHQLNTTGLANDGLKACGNNLFVFNKQSLNKYLWVTDGTSGGYQQLAGPSSYSTDGGCVGNTMVMLSFSGGGYKIYVSDGTVAGSKILSNLVTEPLQFNTLGGLLYFIGKSSAQGYEIWKTDATTAGTSILIDYVSGPAEGVVDILGAWNGKMFFTSYTSEIGLEIHYTDGATTTLFMNVNQQKKGSYPSEFIDFQNKTFFKGIHSGESEVIFSHSLGNPTPEIKIQPASASYVSALTKQNSTNLLFQTKSVTGGSFADLLETDGTQAGTRYLNRLDTYSEIFMDGSTAYYAAKPKDSTLFQLYKYNGTTQQELTKISPPGGQSSSIGIMNKLGSDILFAAIADPVGNEIHKSNGTPGGYSLVKNLNPSAYGSVYNPEINGELGGSLFFEGYDGTIDGIFKTDGTSGGTVLVKDEFFALVECFVPYNGKIYFVGDKFVSSGVYRYELWESDGTTAGTKKVKDLFTYSFLNPVYGFKFRVHDNKMYFYAFLGTYLRTDYKNIYLIASDGTAPGTVVLHENAAHPDSFNDNISTFSKSFWSNNSTGKFYFTGYDATHGFEIWETDGTIAGTKLTFDIIPGPKSSMPSGFFQAGNSYYLSADNGSFGQELMLFNPSGAACPETLQPTGVTALSQKANLSISSGTPNAVQANVNIVYQAGNYIQLNPGFSTGVNAVFMTKLLGGCQ